MSEFKTQTVTKDFKTGNIVSNKEVSGESPTVIQHETRIKGEPTTITREPGREIESKTRDEDPLGLRRTGS